MHLFLIMTLSFSLFGRQFSLGSEAKALSPELSAWTRGEDGASSGAGAKMTSPYSQSSWVYVAVSRLAEKVGSIPFRISRLETSEAKKVRALRGSADPRHRAFVRKSLGEGIVESGAVVDLFNCPHPTMNRQLFWEMVVTWNCLRGEFFILPLDLSDAPVDLKTSAPKISRLVTLPTEMFWHNVVGYDLEGWRYTGSPLASPIPSEFLLPSEVIHSRTPNPFDYWRGMSPLMLAMLPASADYAASQYNKGYWLNNADTGVIVTTDQQATPDQRAAISAALRERKRKAGTADRPLFLWGGAKVEKPTLTGMEQTMIDNRTMNRQEIAAIFKVPDSVMGFSDAKASSLSGGGGAIEQDMIGFIENTITPLCEHLEAAVEPVVKTFGEGLTGWFDYHSLPVMQAARRSRVDAAVKAFGIGATFNEINRVYDLGFEDKPVWGDKSFLPFSLQEAGSVGAEPLPGEDDPKPALEDKGNPLTAMSRLLGEMTTVIDVPELKGVTNEQLWRKHIADRKPTVKLMQARTVKVLFKHRGSVLANLAKFDLKKSIEQRSLIDLLFSPEQFGADLFNELSAPIRAALQKSGDAMREELGFDDPWTMPPQSAKDFLAGRRESVQDCGQTVREQLNASLNAGLDEGETMGELTDRVRAVFNDLDRVEAQRIARTETNIAYNAARQMAIKDAGTKFKAWLSSHGPHVRAAHAQAENDYTVSNPIPVDDPFIVGGEKMLYPGDDSLGAGPGNIINCQCIQLAAKKKKEDAKSITFEICGAGDIAFTKES